MPNQYLPLPPESEIEESLKFYFHLGLNDRDIAEQLKDHYDTERYGLGVKSIQRLRKKWGLKSTRQQKHTVESIRDAIQQIRKEYPTRGAEMLRKHLRAEFNIRASRPLISDYLRKTEPDAVKARRARRFKRRRFHAAGVNDIWAQDQHDKWGPRFGLWLHNNIDPFNMFNNWLRVWWTNKNPRLITRYYLDAVRKYGAIPLTTQSDPGSENYGVANVQTIIRHELDPSLCGTLQHRWKRNKTNVKSEANWSVFRRDFAPGFEDLFEQGVVAGWYNVDNVLENCVFRWIAIPWLQNELDKWVNIRNRTAPRSDRKKVLPLGIPELIRAKPEKFGAKDFKIPVPMSLIDRLELEYAPSDHPVFQLTPPFFHDQVSAFYTSMGSPRITVETFWDTYRKLLQCFYDATIHDDVLNTLMSSCMDPGRNIEVELIPLLEGMKELRQGGVVVGSVDEVEAHDSEFYASFSDDDDEGSGEED